MSTDIGEVVSPPRSFKVTAADGSPVDADSLPTYSITLPDGTTGTPPTVNHGTTGEYWVNFVPTLAGPHADIWTATVAGQVVKFGPDTFHVRPAAPAPLLGLAECRAILGLGDDTRRDELIREYLEAATELMEARMGRAYRRKTVTDVCDGGAIGVLLATSPVQSVSTVTENGGTVPSTGWFVDAQASILYRGTPIAPFPWLPGTQNVSVTYVAGPSVTAAYARQACRVTLQHIWATQGGASGGPQRATGASVDSYAPGASSWSLPRAALELLADDATMGFA